ncbi:MAG: tetratricopeptide repeat protein [Lentisphaerae bacterium]|jgi:hypothetical protein|nr:tetratricopeptide repeat protein [Lentisphaerota bacterium]
MELQEQTAEPGPAGRAWLESLPRAEAEAAAAALAALPRDAAGAGESLPLVIAAWRLVDPARAAALFEGWLDTMNEAGLLSPSFPVVCQWAEQILEAHPDAGELRQRWLPKLARYLEGAFDYYDASGTALPRWPVAAEALFPEEVAPGRITVDLAVLLWNETESFCCLAREDEDAYAKTFDLAEGEQRELTLWLNETFWNSETLQFHRAEDGRNLPDESLCGIVPLVWGGRSAEVSEGLRARVSDWDAANWNARAQILFWALLLRTPHNTVLGRLMRDDLAEGASEVERAVWRIMVAGLEGARGGAVAPIPASARWLDRHGRRIALGAAGLALVLTLVLLGRGLVLREQTAGRDLALLEREARELAAAGQHERAAVRYGLAAKQGRAAYFRYRQAGEWLRAGHPAEAERVYRRLLAERAESPNVRMNLALAVWRQGRRGEALELYRAFVADPAMAEYPGLIERARLAAVLAERQLELDRTE